MNPCEVLTQPPGSREHCPPSSAAGAPPNNGLDNRRPSLLIFLASSEIGVPVCCWGLKQKVEEGSGGGSRETSAETVLCSAVSPAPGTMPSAQ